MKCSSTLMATVLMECVKCVFECHAVTFEVFVELNGPLEY